MQKLNINVLKIDKAALYKGEKGTYMTLTLMTNREGEDKYGNDGFIIQDLSKERRDSGDKGPIIGNWKYINKQQQATPKESTVANDDFEEIPF